jgi:hypothetical protein
LTELDHPAIVKLFYWMLLNIFMFQY